MVSALSYLVKFSSESDLVPHYAPVATNDQSRASGEVIFCNCVTEILVDHLADKSLWNSPQNDDKQMIVIVETMPLAEQIVFSFERTLENLVVLENRDDLYMLKDSVTVLRSGSRFDKSAKIVVTTASYLQSTISSLAYDNRVRPGAIAFFYPSDLNFNDLLS